MLVMRDYGYRYEVYWRGQRIGSFYVPFNWLRARLIARYGVKHEG